MTAENIFRRYPCKPNEYCKIVGGLLPELIANILSEFGFRTEVNVTDDNEVDIKVYQNDNLILVAEVLNWSISSRLSQDRKQQIVRNLSQYGKGCRRALFSSVQAWNFVGWAHQNRIDLVCLGFQVLPENFYHFFYEKGIVDQREPLNDDTKDEVRDMIEGYLREKKLL